MAGFHKGALPDGFELEEYTIETLLGQGGFGITYRAQDRHLQTRVAIKEYFPGQLCVRQDIAAVAPKEDAKAARDYHAGLKNFIKEARALAHFKHPNIVRVLRYLEAHGTAYMVMEYEEGNSLSNHLKQHGPRLDEAALYRIFLPILNGVRAVHEADMLHLDIKPENIYLRRDGSPMLIDFGSTRQAISQTMPEKFLVTHGYAPIEQYPDKGQQGAWTDVYALGASMYRCVVGKRPVNALERYQAVLNYQPDPMAPAVEAAKSAYSPLLLECIDWALKVYPRDRPQSVREFQDRLLNKTASGTRPTTATATAAKTTTTSSATTQAARRGEVAKQASPARPRHAVKQGSNRWLLATMFLLVTGLAAYLWVTYQPLSGSFTGNNAPPAAVRESAPGVASTASGTDVPAPEAVATELAVPAPVATQTLRGHSGNVHALAFSANGRRVATAGNDGSIRIWDSTNGGSLANLSGHRRPVTGVTFSPDGRRLVSVGHDGNVRLWDARTYRQESEWRGPGGALQVLALSSDGGRLTAAGKTRRIVMWDVASGRELMTFTGFTGNIQALAISPNGAWVAAGGSDRTVRLWKTDAPGEAPLLSVQRTEVRALAFSPGHRWLAIGTTDHAIRLIEVGGTEVREFTPAGAAVLALAYTPDGKQLLATTADGKLLSVDAEHGNVLYAIEGGLPAAALAVSPDGRLLGAGSGDGVVRLWRLH